MNYLNMRQELTNFYFEGTGERGEAFREKVYLVWSRPDLRSIDQKMCNNYCYIVLDRVKQCEKTYPDCQELKDTIRNAYVDFEELKRHGILNEYIQKLANLFIKYKALLDMEVV